ncbi:MAG: major outer membrane protein [Nautiliaceae bacterium]|jgi:hypothetical protein
MLKKLSLAALVAMGGMSVASATSLTDAIKNVDLSGFLRVRFYNENPTNKNNSNSDENEYDRWRTNAVLIFKIPVDENIKLVMRNSVESNVYTDEDSIDPESNQNSSVDTAIVNNLLFLQYSNGPVNAMVGKIPVPTSITSADPAKPGHGAGVIASYKINDNVTVAGAFIDAMVNPQNNTDLDGSADRLDDGTDINYTNLNTIGNDTYAANVKFNVDMIEGSIWYYNVTHLVDHIWTATFKIKPVEYATIRLDYANGSLDKDAKLHTTDNGVTYKTAGDCGKDSYAKNHIYGNASLDVKKDGIEFLVGYARSNKNVGVVELSEDAPIGAVIPTANNYNIANKIDTNAFYGKLAYDVDPKTNIYLAAQKQNAGEDSKNENNDLTEYTFGVKYKYNKKLGFDVYYDVANWDKQADYADNNEFRFEAKYSF